MLGYREGNVYWCQYAGVVCWYIEKVMSIGASTQWWYVGI